MEEPAEAERAFCTLPAARFGAALATYSAVQEREEARRLMYVALTRASRSLQLVMRVSAKPEDGYGDTWVTGDVFDALGWPMGEGASISMVDFGGRAPARVTAERLLVEMQDDEMGEGEGALAGEEKVEDRGSDGARGQRADEGIVSETAATDISPVFLVPLREHPEDPVLVPRNFAREGLYSYTSLSGAHPHSDEAAVDTDEGLVLVDSEGAAGITQSLVDNYLNADGTFIDPTNEKFKDFKETFEGRDPRLIQTVMNEGAKFASATTATPMHLEEYTDEKKNTISPPKLAGDGNTRSLTGYHIRLGIDTTFVSGNGETALPIIRYAEGLLAYAEAAAELEMWSDDIANKTLKALRERAGVKYLAPAKDANFTDFGYTLTPVLQEIRRERRSELALQGFRLDDLMRWKADKLIVGKRGKGAYVGDESILFKSYSPDNQKRIRERLTLDDNKWADPMAGTLPSGYQFHADRDYLLPIPPSELELNKKLKQNPKW